VSHEELDPYLVCMQIVYEIVHRIGQLLIGGLHAYDWVHDLQSSYNLPTLLLETSFPKNDCILNRAPSANGVVHEIVRVDGPMHKDPARLALSTNAISRQK
jgi:hypothetical protein